MFKKGYKQTEEHIEKRRQILLGRKLSVEHARKNKEHGFKDGHKNWLGRKHTEESKKKMRVAKLGKYTGENNSNWRGGLWSEPYTTDWTDDLKESIRQRDEYTCRECGIHQDELIGRVRRLDVHHIDYNKENINPKNLISLCKSCHAKTNYNREYWIKYFGKVESNN